MSNLTIKELLDELKSFGPIDQRIMDNAEKSNITEKNHKTFKHLVQGWKEGVFDEDLPQLIDGLDQLIQQRLWSKTIKAILIDAENKKVELIDILPGLAPIYKTIKVQYIEVAYLPESYGKHHLYVDEEGMINGTEYGFWMKGIGQPFFGNGIIFSSDKEGNDIDATILPVDVNIEFWFKSRLELAHYIQNH